MLPDYTGYVSSVHCICLPNADRRLLPVKDRCRQNGAEGTHPFDSRSNQRRHFTDPTKAKDVSREVYIGRDREILTD
jgi:hypothetical protein